MGIGRIISKMANYVSHTKAGQVLHSGKGLNAAKKFELPAQSIFSKVDTNTSGRILRMQDAKEAFTPYATKVTRESVPTMQKIDEITGVARGNVKDATGYFNKQRVADALAAFKHEPVKPSANYVGRAYSTSIPTQKAIDDMLGIVENSPKTRLELLKKRAEIRDIFNNIYRTYTDSTLKKMNLKDLKDISESNELIKTIQANGISKDKLNKFMKVENGFTDVKTLSDSQFRELAKYSKK